MVGNVRMQVLLTGAEGFAGHLSWFLAGSWGPEKARLVWPCSPLLTEYCFDPGRCWGSLPFNLAHAARGLQAGARLGCPPK